MLTLIPGVQSIRCPKLMPGLVFMLPSPWWPWTSYFVPQILDFWKQCWASLLSFGLQMPSWCKQHQMLCSLLWASLHYGILTSVADWLQEMTVVLHLQLLQWILQLLLWRGRVYFSIPWILGGLKPALANRRWQKQYCAISGTRPQEAGMLRFCLRPLLWELPCYSAGICKTTRSRERLSHLNPS